MTRRDLISPVGATTVQRAVAVALSTIAAVPVLGAATADAAAVSRVEGGHLTAPTLVFTAAAGERNQLTVDTTSSAIVLRDRGVLFVGFDLSVLPYCLPIIQGLRCSPGHSIVAELGDGDDRAEMRGPFAEVSGGSGDDVIVGGHAGTTMDGGPGADTFAGGSGSDHVLYSSRTTSVDVTLDGARNDGAPGENDLVGSSIEFVVGGQADDRLVGSNEFGNNLDGGPGDDLLVGEGGTWDTLRGGDGDDELIGGPGTNLLHDEGGIDTVRGGPDRDSIIGANDGLVDDFSCGDGGNDAGILFVPDVLPADCEAGSVISFP